MLRCRFDDKAVVVEVNGVTYVEALLNVDAGHVPAGVTAFELRVRTRFWRYAAASILLAAVAAAGAARGPTALWPLMLVSAAVVTAIIGTRAASREAAARASSRQVTRRVLVVTPSALVMRDDVGLRVWSFDELVDAICWRTPERVELLLVTRDGRRTFVDCLAFKGGKSIPATLAKHYPTRQG